MDPGFNDRVDKVFGSISSSSSSTPWSVTDAQVERRKWKRDERDVDDDEIPVSSSFYNCQTDENDWDIRSSIGLDSTLDNEEEEDAYDKMAQGREDSGDRLYMNDVTDHNVLPRSLHDAAKTRLKEDDELMLHAKDPIIGIKSILKRKSCDEGPKPAKRVRFDSSCKNAVNVPDVTQVSENGRGVPDYLLNPSKYMRYTFDDSARDDRSDYLEQSSKHGGVEEKSCGELPKSVVFIPRKKRDDAGCNSVKQSPTQTIGIAAVEVQQGEASELQEDGDDVCIKARCRQYRSKMEECDDVS